MAAYAALLSLRRILQQLKDPDLPVLHEKQQIESLQEKVSFLVDFLDNYSVYTDKVVKDLEIKMRDAAYEADDIIESYISTSILSQHDGGNSIGVFETFCQDMERIIKETHSIQQEVMDIKRMLELNYVQQRKTLPVDISRLTFTDTIPSMVGLDEDKDKIKDWLTSSSSKLEVISIVGMGGIGKTTLARKLFDDSLIVCMFDVRAWVTVSQDYQMREVFSGLLDSTNKLNPEMRNVGGEELADRLYKSLKGRKYIIVMDDVWDAKVWDEVKRFFPDDHNGSRIVLTTRLKNVGDHAASFEHRHDMRPLDSRESWDLFRQKVFGGECCPPCLEEIGREIIRNCRGLPLSIVVLGGLLSMDKTVSYWKTIATTLKSVLSIDGGHCSSIFSLSYNHLPTHLKPLYLYFAIFPEDYYVKRSKLIRLWIAEGFINPNGSKSLEEIAGECLEDLSNRSLIMVHELRCDGKVKTYRIHDLLKDFCTTEAQKEKFLHVTDCIHSNVIRSELRVSIQPVTPSESIEHTFNSNEPPLPTRSLLLYHKDADIIISEHSFGLLRVLDMRYKKWLKVSQMEVLRYLILVHLRYLSLPRFPGHFHLNFPASISSIWFLQTIVIERFDTGINLPIEVWTMRHLRHVRIRKFLCLPNFPNVKNRVILANLQTLSKIRNFIFTDEIIKRIPKLKRLGVWYDSGIKDDIFEDWFQFHLSNIVCLNELETLYFTCFPTKSISPNFKFPVTLKKLVLDGGDLHWEDLTMISLLPNLEVLKLDDSCKGEVWEPNEGEFRQLKFLQLYRLNLMEWRADDSHFPKLKCLQIVGCPKLKEIPIGTGNIPTLEMIELDDRSPSAVISAKLILDEQRSFGNDVLQVRIMNASGRIIG